MAKLFKFKIGYFILALLIFFVEVIIAVFIHDNIIRPYIGDLLVVVLIYFFLRSLLNISVFSAAVATLIFSYVVEFLQYFNIVSRLGLGDSKIARIVIGTSFAWMDLLAYSIGIILVICFEKMKAVRGSVKPGNVA